MIAELKTAANARETARIGLASHEYLHRGISSRFTMFISPFWCTMSSRTLTLVALHLGQLFGHYSFCDNTVMRVREAGSTLSQALMLSNLALVSKAVVTVSNILLLITVDTINFTSGGARVRSHVVLCNICCIARFVNPCIRGGSSLLSNVFGTK